MRFDGASIPEQPFRHDDGSVDPGVADALAAASAGEALDLIAVLRGTRLLSPLVAVLDSTLDGAEKDSHLAAPYLVGQDGRRASLAFTSTAAAQFWDRNARVVPSTAEATAAAALGDGAAALVLDAADPHAVTLGFEALHRLAGQLAPVPDIAESVERALAELGSPMDYDLTAGPEGVPLLTVTTPGRQPSALLQELARLLGADPLVRTNCPVGLDFGVSREDGASSRRRDGHAGKVY
jgi:hypothetical protein